MQDIKAWVMVDDQGNYVVGHGQAEMQEKWDEEYTDEGSPTRVVCVTLKVALPKVVRVEATIPEEASGASVVVK